MTPTPPHHLPSPLQSPRFSRSFGRGDLETPRRDAEAESAKSDLACLLAALLLNSILLIAVGGCALWIAVEHTELGRNSPTYVLNAPPEQMMTISVPSCAHRPEREYVTSWINVERWGANCPEGSSPYLACHMPHDTRGNGTGEDPAYLDDVQE